MGEHDFTPDELKLVEALNKQELTKKQASDRGYNLSNAFLLKCEQHGVKLYEYEVVSDKKRCVKYGILKREVIND
jgi:hypothetical protein